MGFPMYVSLRMVMVIMSTLYCMDGWAHTELFLLRCRGRIAVEMSE